MNQSQSGQSRLPNFDSLEFDYRQPWAVAASAQGELDCATPDSHCWPISPVAYGIVPANYEPRYAYPLVIWLSGNDCAAPQSLAHIAGMSPQNYVGISIKGCSSTFPDVADRSEQSGLDAAVDTLRWLVDIENRIVAAVKEFRRTVNVHMERFILAGAGDAASTAMLVAIHQTDWFNGCVSFGGSFPAASRLLTRHSDLTSRRFWLSAPGDRSGWSRAEQTRHAARQLIASGADVTTQFDSSALLVSPHMLKAVDQWIITGILAEA